MEPNLAQELTGYAGDAVAQSQNPSTSNPFIINPGTGQYVSNPNFMNALQALELRLTADPTFSAHLQNMKQLETLVPVSELATYRDAQGNTPALGTTYADLQDGQYQQINPQQNEEVTQLTNALNSLSSAYAASKSLSGGSVTAGIGGLLSKVGLGSVANTLPGYSSYNQAVSGIQGSNNPYLQGASGLFSTPGVAPDATQYQTFIANLQNQLQRLNASNVPQAVSQPQQAPIPTAVFNPMSTPNTNPYSGTQNSVISNPAQLGANARNSVF